MARRQHLGAVVAVVALALLAEPAGAVRRGRAETSPGGVEVEIIVGDNVEVRGGVGGDDGCEWSATRYPFTGVEPPASAGEQPSPEHELYLVYCNGTFVSVEWLGPRETAEVTARELVDRYLETVLVSQVGVGVRPEARGVTGLPSYFWVDGYDGRTIAEPVGAFGIAVDVEIAFASATWDFGDETPPVQGLGEPWPERSSVRHTYRDRGDRTITVTLAFDPRYRVDGGEWQTLPPITRTASLAYAVDEVQAVRDR